MPQRKQNFIEGAAVLTLAVAVTKVIGAVYKIPLGNLLDKDGMAHFYVAYNIYSLLLIVSTAGLPLAMSRLVARAEALGQVNRRRRIFRVTGGLFLLLGVVCGGIMLLFAEPLAELMNDSLAAPAIRVLAPAVLCVCLLSAIRGYTQGLGDMRPTAVSQIIESACKLVVGLTAAWLLTRHGAAPNESAAGAISGVAVGAVISLGVLSVWLLRLHRRDQRGTDVPESRKEILRQVLRIGIPVTLGSVGMSLITLLDQTLVLGTLQSSLGLSEEAAASLYGEYTFGMTLFALPASFMYPLSISLVPSISAAMARHDVERAGKNAAAALKLAMVAALPVGVGMSTLAGPILHLLYPAVPQTAEAAAYHLRVLGIASVFVCMMIATAGILQAYGRERIPVVTLLIGGGVKIAANYLLVTDPAISIHGAPIGTLLCYAVIAGLNLVAVAVTVPGRPPWGRAALKLLLTTTAMAAAAHCSYGLLAGPVGARGAAVAAILLAAAVYIVLLLSLEVVSREEIKQLPKGEKLAKFLFRA